MNTKEHKVPKARGDADVSYLGKTVDAMIWEFMEANKIPGLTLAIVQAPYIPRVVGYGLSDTKERRLASVNTMYPAGGISQGFAAVAIMQLVELKKLSLSDTVGTLLSEMPQSWREISVLELLHHATGIADFTKSTRYATDKAWSFYDLVSLVNDKTLAFKPGTEIQKSATNFLILTEIIEKVSGMSYHDFVTERQIKFLGLRHTGFFEDLKNFNHEAVSLTENVHQLFKKDKRYVDPTEYAVSYDNEGKQIPFVNSSALKGSGDIWASAGDISFWDICLAGGILISDPKHREVLYKSWNLPDGREAPASAGWQFYFHHGLMDIKGGVPGYSAFLSRFTDPSELVCVTLLGNKSGIDFTNLGRRIAGAFGDLLSTGYDDNQLFLYESQFSPEITVKRLEDIIKAKGITLFAKYDHAKYAKDAGLALRATTVLVIGSPAVGTALMQADQSISLELPLRISVWEDEKGSTWIATPRLFALAARYGQESNPVVEVLEKALENIIEKAGSSY